MNLVKDYLLSLFGKKNDKFKAGDEVIMKNFPNGTGIIHHRLAKGPYNNTFVPEFYQVVLNGNKLGEVSDDVYHASDMEII